MDRFTRAGRREDESFGLPAGQVAGFSVLFAALLAAFFLFPGQLELIFGVFVAALGGGKAVAGHLAARDNDELPPASRAFRELADPMRPLTPLVTDDPTTVAPPPAIHPGAALPEPPPADEPSRSPRS